MIKQIEKKITETAEKKGNKKRQATIDFFKEHLNQLRILSDWLNCPTRRFHHETTQQLLSKIKDIVLSSDDTIFQDDLKAIYNKIIASAN